MLPPLHIVASVLALATVVGCLDSRAETDPPNIVFIMADDLGYGDLGCFGQQIIRTPHLDRMARQGMRLTQHYAGSPVCAPARCVLMTGMHPGQAIVRNNRGMAEQRFVSGIPDTEGQFPLPADTQTLPQLLREHGYVTGGFGKWGLGGPDSSGAPLRQGFDRWFGYNCQSVAHNYYPVYLWDDDQITRLDNPPFSAHDTFSDDEDPNDPASYRRFQGNEYSADLIAEQALQFIRDNTEQPFFLYWPTTVPHVALQVPDDSLEEYINQFDDPPYKGGRGYIPHYQPRAAYAAMITRMDREIGRAMDLIEELGLDQQTIFVFTSDNGPTHGRHQGLAGTDATFFNAHGGLRDGKGMLYEGGIRVPTIVRWTGQVPPGSTTERLSGFEDWLPTLMDLVGASERIAQPVNGISMAPTILGDQQPARDLLYREFAGYGGQQSIHAGPWKLVRLGLRGRPDKVQVELYNLEDDPAEENDLAEQHPEKLRQLIELANSQRTPSADFPIAVLDQETSSQ